MTYRIVLFFHIAGAVATFVGVVTLFLTVLQIRRAQRTEEVLSLAWIYEMGSALGLLGILVVAGSGLYMAATAWGLGRGWVLVAIAAFALMSPVWPLIVAPRIEFLIRDVRNSAGGPLPAAVVARQSDPVPKVGVLAVIGDLVGIVFVMTVKPSLAGSIVAVLTAVVVGIALGLPAVGRAVNGAVAVFFRLERQNPLYRR